jgi:hypothetical protein
VEQEAVLPADDQRAWDAALGELWRSPQARGRFGERALQSARRSLSEGAYYRRLLDIYEGPIGAAQSGGAAAHHRAELPVNES